MQRMPPANDCTICIDTDALNAVMSVQMASQRMALVSPSIKTSRAAITLGKCSPLRSKSWLFRERVFVRSPALRDLLLPFTRKGKVCGATVQTACF